METPDHRAPSDLPKRKTPAKLRSEGTAAGVGFALLAGAFWAGYILLGHREARSPASVDGLGLGMLVGALAISPFGAAAVGGVLDSALVLGLAVATGLLSNVIPYRIDQTVMRRIDAHRFALLQTLLPATATVVGLATLTQVPTGQELLGIGLVIAAIAGSGPGRRTSGSREEALIATSASRTTVPRGLLLPNLGLTCLAPWHARASRPSPVW